jgi:hypothetical protein
LHVEVASAFLFALLLFADASAAALIASLLIADAAAAALFALLLLADAAAAALFAIAAGQYQLFAETALRRGRNYSSQHGTIY